MGNTEIFKNSHTFRLFKKEPSVIDGFVSLLDMTPNSSRYNQDETEKEADTNSLNADWYAIGDDLRNVISKYEQQPKQTSTTK